MDYSKHFNTTATPQTEQIPGTNQVPNSGGGFSFVVDNWTRLRRFLILGTEGGTYYATERKLTIDNAKIVSACLDADGKRTIDEIVSVSDAGRAPKNDPAIFALALACRHKTPETAEYARSMIPRVCRIGTHLFHLVQALSSLGGWGRGIRRAVGDWYSAYGPAELALQLAKYQQRDGWSHRDVLRLAHPTPKDDIQAALLGWAAAKEPLDWGGAIVPAQDPSALLWATDFVKKLDAKKSSDVSLLCHLIQDYRLPREVIPTEFLNDAAVWDSLLVEMPVHAMVRNLGKMSAVGLLKPFSKATAVVTDALANRDKLRKARMHPMSVLVALNTYKSNKGVKGSLTWQSVPAVCDALNDAFYSAFDLIEPTGKRFLLGVDVSGSMGHSTIAGMPGITPAVAAACMAMVTARTEQQNYIMGFCHTFVDLHVTPKMRLDEVVKKISNLPFGATDCSLPMAHAYRNKWDVDCFAVYTDNETNYGNLHPSQAIKQYRAERVPGAKLVVAAFTATDLSIADPTDAGMMDCVGLDTSTPAVISDFVRG